jgi:signal transduction histidine kinase
VRSTSNVLLVGGSLGYAAIQPLALFSSGGDWVEVAGFSLGFLCKSAILIGLAGTFVISAENTVRIESMQRRVAEVARTVGRITHELGTPIRHLDVQVAKLRRIAPKHGDFTTHLTGLEQTSLRIDAVIEATLALLPSPDTLIDITSISRSPEGALPARAAQVVNVNTLLQLAAMVVKETRGEGAVLRPSYSGNCCITCVPFEIVQVFINLLRNSYDAVARFRRGTISLISRSTADGMVEVEVIDDGEGISAEKMHVIFTEGFSTRAGPGRGYGLAIVKELVERNGGTINIRSPAGSETSERLGTSALLRFPKIHCLTKEERLERTSYSASAGHRR